MRSSTLKFFLCLAILVSALVAEGAAKAPSFKFTTITVPGAAMTQLFGINNAGDMVGDYLDNSGLWHGLLISAGHMTTIDHPGASVGTYLYGINSTGTIAGFYQDSVGGQYGFTYSGGVFTAIAPTGTIQTGVYGINDSGVVVGAYWDASNVQHGFFGTPSTGYTTLNVPKSTATLGFGINAAGNVTLVWKDSGGLRHGALYTAKTKKFKTLNVPASIETLIRGIDTKGDIAFAYTDSAGTHGALYTGGKYYICNDPAQPNNTRASGINDKRVMVGNIVDSSGNWSGIQITY